MKKSQNYDRNQRIQMLLSKMSASIAIVSLTVWTYLTVRLSQMGLSKKEIMSILILMGNDGLRIGLSVVEHHTSKYLYLRAIPLTLQILLLRREVLRKLIAEKNLDEWMRLLQFIVYANLTVDILFTLFTGFFMFDSKIVFLAFLEILLI